jgi:hypothetical protein
MAMFRNLTGQRFGKLTVVARAPNDVHGNTYWHCVCECGGGRLARADNLLRGRVQRCPACAAPSVQIETWYHLGPHVSAGFALATREGAALLVPRWIEAPPTPYGKQPAALVECVQQLMQAGIVRVNDKSVRSAHAWLRRHRRDVTYHAYNRAEELREWWQKWNAHWSGQSEVP